MTSTAMHINKRETKGLATKQNHLQDLKIYIYFKIYINFLTDLKIIQGVSNQVKSPASSDFFKIFKDLEISKIL